MGQVELDVLNTEIATHPPDPEAIGRFIRHLKNDVYRRYAKRLLGAAAFSRLEQAFKDDAAVVVLALRRGLRAAMPLSVAWRDTLGVMTPQQLDAISTTNSLGADVFDMLLDLDDLVNERVIPQLPLDRTSATPTDLKPIDRHDLDRLFAQFRTVISLESVRRVKQVNEYLTVKIDGARHALEHSADGISQAANSLIELIDRLLRLHFDDDTILSWIDENLPDEPELTYMDEGKRRPTKRAQALCFVYAGSPVICGADQPPGPAMVHDVLAKSFVAARNQLQHLKHAETGDAANRADLQRILTGVEGMVVLTLRLGWALTPTNAFDELGRHLGEPSNHDLPLSA